MQIKQKYFPVECMKPDIDRFYEIYQNCFSVMHFPAHYSSQNNTICLITRLSYSFVPPNNICHVSIKLRAKILIISYPIVSASTGLALSLQSPIRHKLLNPYHVVKMLSSTNFKELQSISKLMKIFA